ncbi:hypothetical protein H5399_05030 [Tessaracoccus sp. MC1627]|uniref:hypothetical protein n=1 Tax=Tessaracoccus sp. MC1627 TaxID=2760312 RepID=UPI0016029B4B|nr:hypothetical protein [Tessaracoccus sp. MC1627]MBB1511967.1 hypothetical protein [Tessaracoccus sp. MC1627]
MNLLSLLASSGGAVIAGHPGNVLPLRSLTLAQTVDATPTLRTVTTAPLTDPDLVAGGERITAGDGRLRLIGYSGTTDGIRPEAHSYEFTYTGTELAFRLDASGAPSPERAVRVYVDGAPVTAGMVVGIVDSQYRVALGAAGLRTVRIDLARVALTAIDTTAGAIVTATRPRTKVYILGDSWVQGYSYVSDGAAGIQNGPGLEHMAFVTGRLLDASMVIGGIGGSGYGARQAEGLHYASAARMSRIVDHAPDYLIVFGSINDDNDAESTAGTYAAELYAHVAANLPSCRIVVVGVQDYGQAGVVTDSSPTVTTATAAAPNVAAYVQPRVLDWVPTGDSTINNTAYNNAHLTVYGNRFYAEKLRDVVMGATP